MSFNPANLVKLQPSTLFTQPATIPNVTPSTVAPQFWLYNAGTDDVAAVTASGYFYYFGNTRTIDTLLYNNGQLFNIGDILWCVCNDDYVWVQITAIVPVITTTLVTADPSSVNTLAIQNGAVTTAKIANNAVTAAQIANGTITTTQISGTAGITGAQLANGTITSTQLAANAVVTAGITNANVTLAKLSAGITPSNVVKYAAQYTTLGGAAAEAITVTGALATDLAFVQLVAPGGNTVTVHYAVVTSNTLTVTFSADPGSSAIINYQLLRAAS